MSNFCLKKDETLKAAAAHLYPDFTPRAPPPPPGFICLFAQLERLICGAIIPSYECWIADFISFVFGHEEEVISESNLCPLLLICICFNPELKSALALIKCLFFI